MQIRLASVMIDDQEKALPFYTDVLGFAKKADIPMGTFRWLTVTSPGGSRGRRAGARAYEFPSGQGLPKKPFSMLGYRRPPS